MLSQTHVLVQLCSPQIPHGVAWNFTRPSAQTDRRLIVLSHGSTPGGCKRI